MKNLNIYHLQHTGLRHVYDTYDSFVCIAESKEEAKDIHPVSKVLDRIVYLEERDGESWPVDKIEIICTKIGKAKKGSVKGVVCASFNAG